MFALFPSFPPSTPSLGVRAVHWFVFLVRCRSLRPHPLALALACIGLVHHDCRPPVHASERVGSCRGHLYLATGVRAAVSASTRAWQQALPAVPGGVYAMHACRQAGSSPAHFTRGGVAHNTGRAAACANLLVGVRCPGTCHAHRGSPGHWCEVCACLVAHSCHAPALLGERRG